MVNFPLYFRNTMTIMIPVLAGTLLTSSMCGYGFARLRFPLKRLWFSLIISSLMLPYAVTMLPTFLLWARLGAINTFVPLTVPVWFGGGAFNIFLLRQFFLTLLSRGSWRMRPLLTARAIFRSTRASCCR